MFIVPGLASKLDTNYVPSDAEVEEIMSALTEPLQRLSLLDERIAQLQEAINALVPERTSLNDEIERHQALISPARRIPQDVLEVIFAACLPTTHDAIISATEAPLLLGHICSYWRSVAHSMPTLWMSLYIPWATSSFGNDSAHAPSDVTLRFAEIVQEWLRRSGTSPISLSITFLSILHPAFETPLRAVFQRLRHLGVYSGTESMAQFLGDGGNNFPALESLTLHSRDESPSDFWSTMQILNVPTLRKISLQLRGNLMAVPLRWEGLTELNLHCHMRWPTNNGVWEGGFRTDDSVEILRRCPKLVKCRLHVTRDEGFEAHASTTASELRSLVITEAVDISDVLDCLDMPNLQHLGLDLNPATDATGTEEHFLRAVGRHTESLTSVDFSMQLFSLETLLGFLQLVPRLRELCLRRSNGYLPVQSMTQILDDAFLTHLTPTPSTSGMCPLLTEVDFQLCASFSDDALAQFITARMRSPQPLEAVHVDFERQVQRELKTELEPFTATGALRLNLVYYPPVAWQYYPRGGLTMLDLEGR
ncbi:hypothetical protein DFH09DRAFT_1199240 [Mycena vulgaris]|nr:hypothetical protein DFH09DRAFT_1199240 [Mycena vulgaris]